MVLAIPGTIQVASWPVQPYDPSMVPITSKTISTILKGYGSRIERVGTGGTAMVIGTDIPVWQVERAWRAGLTDVQVFDWWPALTVADLQACRAFVLDNRYEIDLDLLEQDATFPTG